MRHSRAPRVAVVLLAGMALLTACAGDPAPAPSPSASATPAPSPSPSPEPEPIVAPLTGVEVDTAITGPAIAAKIDDHPDARPQYGLEQADVVFEELVEGGLTRYVGVWHSSIPEELGPVRSIRPMDPAIIAPLGGMVAYSGGQQRFVDAMQETGLVNVIHGGEYDAYFFRTGQRIAPHNVILDAQRLAADNASIAPPQPLFSYPEEGASPSSQAAGAPASRLDLAFSPSQSRQWTCDATSGRWLRAQQGVADMDANGGQLGATNVVVLRVGVVDNGGVPETVLAGSGGEGLVASGCSWAPVTWSKADAASPIQIVDAGGQAATLAPGSTWVELVPTTGSASAS